MTFKLTAAGRRLRPQTLCCEIVRADAARFLINSRQQACRYETADGCVLAPGHYLVVSPVGSNTASYGRTSRYFGPVPTLTAARLLHTSALALGIVATAEERPAYAPVDLGGSAFGVSPACQCA